MIEIKSTIENIKQCNKYCKASDISSWNTPVNDFHKQQKCCSDQKSNRRCLTDCSLNISNEQRNKINSLACFHRSQWCRSGCCIIEIGHSTCWNCKICHFTSKRNHQKTSSCQSRVHKVLSQTSKQLFYNENRKYAAQSRHPKWNHRRHIHAKQKSCQDCTEISNCYGFMHTFFVYVFCSNI